METVSEGWRRASACSTEACIEVRAAGDHVQMHGGSLIKPHDKTVLCLSFTSEEWTAFLAGVKAGEFDDLAAP